MVSFAWLVAVGLPLFYFIHTIWNFFKYLRIAKASGMRYVVLPVHAYGIFWRITHNFWINLFDKALPESWNGIWRMIIHPDWAWVKRYSPFEALGTDTFLAVSPGGIILYTADADVISQMCSRRNDFPKPIYLYKGLDIFGKNVVSSEGANWRHHRKLTSPPFSEKNNHVVFKETLSQTQQMLVHWVGEDGRGNRTIRHIAEDTMRLSLHVISRAGFGQELKWPEPGDQGGAFGSDDIPAGHSMSFAYSLHSLLSNLFPVILLPRWALERAPFQALRKSLESYNEWFKYMREMIAEKKRALKTGAAETSNVDLIGQLIKAQVDEKTGGAGALTDSEVMGNAFVFMLAGHETTANSIHFALILLALHPSTQSALKAELDEIFQGRPISEWDYDRDLPRLFGGLVGATLNEELRILPPVTALPKSTWDEAQSLIVDGKEVTVPAQTLLLLCIASVHRNPKFWPAGPPRDPRKPYFPPSNPDNDLEEFKPERWLKTEHQASSKDEKSMLASPATAEDDLNLNHSADTASSLFTPPKGAYIPFSDGFRACLGRRFAQVEVIAALAMILSQYTVELAVDEWASDEEFEQMDVEQKKDVWKKAEKAATEIWQKNTSTMITLQIRGAHVPLRFVRKGDEKFNGLDL